MDESFVKLASVLQAAEIVHARVDPIEPLRVLAFVCHTGGTFALFNGGDVNVMGGPEHRSLVAGVNFVVVKREFLSRAVPGIKSQQRSRAMIAMSVDGP